MPQGRRSSGKVAASGTPLARTVLPESQLIDTGVDTQSEPAAMAVDAGISGLKVLYRGGKVTIPVTLSIRTSTGLHRGVHMSRLVHAASTQQNPDLVGWLRGICRQVNKTQMGCSVACSFELPYADQFIPVSVATKQAGTVHYQFTAKGMTACPCSKKMIGIGHMQRAELVMAIDGRKAIDMFKVVEKMEECFSAVPTEKMKRVEEAKKILEAQDHARFAEDLVRECVKRFPNAAHVRGRCFESIHAHDAIATWSRTRGLPDFGLF